MRMRAGRETWNRLLNWDREQAASERLAALILANEGFRNIDPSHPLGGKDGLKDMILTNGGKKWIGAVYFPRGQKSFQDIKDKFCHDLEGVRANGAKGIAFVTNQEIRLSERKILAEIDKNIDVNIYHLERIASLLNMPMNYGIRMEFLEIEMEKEEQISFFAMQNKKMAEFEDILKKITIGLEEFKQSQGNIFGTQHKLQTCCEEDAEDNHYEEETRTLEEIVSAIDELFDKIWFDRHLSLRYRIENKGEYVDPEIWKGALAAAQEVINKYGEENLGPYSDFEWGMLNGKLSALRWVLGDEWDMLDT